MYFNIFYISFSLSRFNYNFFVRSAKSCHLICTYHNHEIKGEKSFRKCSLNESIENVNYVASANYLSKFTQDECRALKAFLKSELRDPSRNHFSRPPREGSSTRSAGGGCAIIQLTMSLNKDSRGYLFTRILHAPTEKKKTTQEFFSRF